jgi:CubicO group peptidase (beta-lactamase class C family)
MRTRFIPALIAVGLAGAASGTALVGQTRDPASLAAYIERTRQDWNVAGVAVAVVRNDTVVFARGFGHRDVRTRLPVGPNTAFAIGSMTKFFTAVAAGLMVETGKMEWDAPLRRYLPSFEVADPYVTANLSLRDALTHRSGLDWRLDFIWVQNRLSRAQVLERLHDFVPDPGFRLGYSYSNLMFLAAGEAIAAAAGRTWEDFVRDRLLEPLGMRSSAPSLTGLAAGAELAQPHTNFGGPPVPIEWVQFTNTAPAGAIVSTALDMTRWLRFALGRGQLEGKRLIQERTLDEIVSPVVVVGQPDRELRPLANFMLYGMGVELLDYRGRRVIKHGGRVNGMSSEFAWIPDAGLGLVILTNTNGPAGVSDFPVPLTYRIIDHYLGAPEVDWSAKFLAERRSNLTAREAAARRAETARVPDTKPSLPLAAYVGSYAGPMGNGARAGSAESTAERIGPFAAVNLENGRLMLRLGSIESSLEHWQYDTFRLRWDPIGQLFATFSLDGKGGVERFQIDFVGEFKKVATRADSAPSR